MKNNKNPKRARQLYGSESTGRSVTRRPPAIRKPRPCEPFYLPGHAEFRYSLKTKEITGSGDMIEVRYRTVTETALHAILPEVVPVLFHEAYAENGELYAFPQVLHKDRLVPPAWRRCEREVFTHHPLQLWMSIDYGENLGEYVLGIDDCNEGRPLHDPDFARKLDAALAPNLIDDVDHPVVRCLHSQFGYIQDDDIPQEWDIG